ncbi:MAG: flagellar biosynthesis protein FlhA [Bacillota bacterium]|jgi:flagellar biosynthesis protein FlhA
MRKLLDNTILIFILCIIGLIIIPLNPLLLDVIIILNIVLSLTILLLAMSIKETLEFSVFPSLLLITTLFRIALNVSSTRLILGNDGYAGNVIKTFGEFVIGGDPIVGFIIFLIIVIVQFIIITKGSERVAEVSARFTLDAMPGKQMAIDADLNSGLINEQMAKSRRENIQMEANFYGAMDGASKFVKGDAIVSIIILFINLIGGSLIGIVINGRSFDEVLSIYTIATVGDGLVTQIPALLISTATGIIVTRAASQNNLSTDLARQLLAYPIAITITGGVLLGMCVIPGMPVPFLLLIGAFLIFMGRRLSNKKNQTKEISSEDLPPSETEFFRDINNIYSLLNVEPIEMEFGYSLIPLVDENKGGSFIDRVVMLRRQFASEMGMVIPSVRLRDDAGLEPNQYVIKIKGEKVAQGEVLVDHFLVVGQIEGNEEIEGIDTVEPAFGMPALWVDQENREKAQIFGYTVIDPLSVIITHLSEIIKNYAHELLTRHEVNKLLDNIRKIDKSLVDDFIPSVISVSSLQKVLCNLLMEQIPIKDLTTILETVGEFAPTVKDLDILTEYVRQSLKRTITSKYTEEGSLKVITVNTELENIILNSVKKTDHGSYVAMEPETMQKIVSSHMKEVAKISEMVKTPIILTSPVVRIYYRKLIEQFSSETVVLSFNEIEPNIKVVSVGSIAATVA